MIQSHSSIILSSLCTISDNDQQFSTNLGTILLSYIIKFWDDLRQLDGHTVLSVVTVSDDFDVPIVILIFFSFVRVLLKVL